MSARDDYRPASSDGMCSEAVWGPMCDEIDYQRDLAKATEESRYKWQRRALESEAANFGLKRFALLIVSLNRTRVIDEVIAATPDDILRLIDPDMVQTHDTNGAA